MTTLQLELTDSVRKALLEELRPVVREIVEQVLLERRYNANGHRTPGPKPKPPPPIRICRKCRVLKPAAEYGKGRATCRTCRRRQSQASAARRHAARLEHEAALRGERGERARQIALGQRRPGVNVSGEFAS